jgi:hypothetical protein
LNRSQSATGAIREYSAQPEDWVSAKVSVFVSLRTK